MITLTKQNGMIAVACDTLKVFDDNKPSITSFTQPHPPAPLGLAVKSYPPTSQPQIWWRDQPVDQSCSALSPHQHKIDVFCYNTVDTMP